MKENLEDFCIEFVKKHFKDERTYNPSSIITAMKVSAKWQQERSYSEEDMFKFWNRANLEFKMKGKIDFKELFEQFKKI